MARLNGACKQGHRKPSSGAILKGKMMNSLAKRARFHCDRTVSCMNRLTSFSMRRRQEHGIVGIGESPNDEGASASLDVLQSEVVGFPRELAIGDRFDRRDGVTGDVGNLDNGARKAEFLCKGERGFLRARRRRMSAREVGGHERLPDDGFLFSRVEVGVFESDHSGDEHGKAIIAESRPPDSARHNFSIWARFI